MKGSSAGAGSEVFHIYRHLRRKETLRQNYIREEAEKEEKEEEFQMKLAANKAKSEGSTAKKRAKRFYSLIPSFWVFRFANGTSVCFLQVKEKTE
jgi:hypothetical protein